MNHVIFYFLSPSVKCGWWPLAIYILSVEICWYRNSLRSNCFCSYVSSVPRQIACVLKMFPSGIASCYWWVDPGASLISRACTCSVAAFEAALPWFTWAGQSSILLQSESAAATPWLSQPSELLQPLTLASISLAPSIILWLTTWIDTLSVWVLFLLVLWTLDWQIF